MITAFYGIREFITVFRGARLWSLSWDRRNQFTSSHYVSLRYILISFYLCLNFLVGSFLHALLTVLFMHASLTHATSPAQYSPSFDNFNNICWRLQIMKLLSKKFSQALCYFIPLRRKYSPQHPISNALSLYLKRKAKFAVSPTTIKPYRRWRYRSPH
jgi:hypothetical protein